MWGHMKKRLRTLWSCNAVIGRAWGLSPKIALWLYKRVIIPKITYVDVALWDRMGNALARSQLEHLQRAACIMITGAMRTTKVLEMLLDLPNFGMAVKSAAPTAAYHLLRLDSRNLRIEYNRIWAKADKVNGGRRVACLKAFLLVLTHAQWGDSRQGVRCLWGHLGLRASLYAPPLLTHFPI